MKKLFYGWESADVPPVQDAFRAVSSPRVLYALLTKVWCEYTCAPRLRAKWSGENITLGQCSVTSFLAQDIFGGKVCGVLRSGGNYHCYNVVGDTVFDLTSAQFGDEVLDYSAQTEQFRSVHFADEEKKARYEYLREHLLALL